MKGSDVVKMTINIGGELIRLDVDFDDQLNVRNTEREIKQYIEHLRKQWPDNSDRNILAMAVYQFARWMNQLKDIQQNIIDLTHEECLRIDEALASDSLIAED